MKLPIAYTLGNREASLDKDALLRNGLVEVDGDPQQGGLIKARKRPALESAYVAASAAAVGQGLFVWSVPPGGGGGGGSGGGDSGGGAGAGDGLSPSSTLVSITGDTLNTAPSAISKQLAFTVQPS